MLLRDFYCDTSVKAEGFLLLSYVLCLGVSFQLIFRVNLQRSLVSCVVTD